MKCSCGAAARLAPRIDNHYILGNPGNKVKISYALPEYLLMILSMTGFASVAAELPGCSLTVELRSVNHRYLDLQVRLPDELRALESAVREVLSSELKRGKVDCRIALNRSVPGSAAVAVSVERVIQLRDAAAEVKRHVPNSTPLSVVEILRWPGVLAEPSMDVEMLAGKTLALVR